MQLIEQILREEEDGLKSASILFEIHQKGLKKLEKHIDLENLYLLQAFKVRVAYRYLNALNFAKARSVFESIIYILQGIKKTYLGHRIYHEALLGLAECEIYFHRALRSEHILKKQIELAYLESPRRLNNLVYESNGQYWTRKVRLLNGFSVLLFFFWIVTHFVMASQSTWMQACGWISGLCFIGTRIYRMLNQDRIALDFLEIIIVRNVFRDWLNRSFQWNLGYQKELDHDT